jgi:hypothetical protein
MIARVQPRALVAGLVLWATLVLGGCATVNPQSAARLSSEAQLTTRAIADTLEDTRKQLETFVEGQSMHAHLTGRSALSPAVLCSIKAVQRSLRLRVLLLRKLAFLYDSFIALAERDVSGDNLTVFDEIMADVDRYELLPDATPGPTCPDPEPERTARRAPPIDATPPSKLLGFSRSASMRRASAQIRQVLGKFISLWDAEREIYLSIQKQAFLSQKALSRALLTKFGTVSPASVFAPQLTGLGVAWDDLAYRAQLAKWPPEKQAAVQEAILGVLDRRAEHRVVEEEARYVLYGELLRVVYRQHQVLEQGQPLDLRQLNVYLAPILRSVSSASPTCKTVE